MRARKEERNRELVLKRLSNPEKWSFEELRKFYGFRTKSTVHEIFHKYADLYRPVLKKQKVRVSS